MVPDIVKHTLISARKFADADDISIYDGNEVRIYYGQTAKIRISEAKMLKGWRLPVTKLWRISLKVNTANHNADTLILNSQDGQQPRNPLYYVPTSKTVLQNMQTLITKHKPEAINNLYELRSIERTTRYLHAASCFPKKKHVAQIHLKRKLYHLATHQHQ